MVTSIDLSMREDLILPPRQLTICSTLVPAFDVLHIDPNEQAAEKIRCLAERTKVGDGFDVHLLWRRRDLLDASEIKKLVPQTLTSGKEHRTRALAGIDSRYERWRPGEDELPLDSPTRDEMRAACRAAVEAWVE